MSQTSLVQNPFMMMISPEVVLAAVEKSERLSRLNSRLCRPLDRPQLSNGAKVEEDGDDGVDDGLQADGAQ